MKQEPSSVLSDAYRIAYFDKTMTPAKQQFHTENEKLRNLLFDIKEARTNPSAADTLVSLHRDLRDLEECLASLHKAATVLTKSEQ